ncbi:MAG: nicotinate-nucleotide adenylyltransferase [Cyanobacteria bacterium P01_A01_bin.105]
MHNIALFGTSADPPHEGHRGILAWLSQRFDHVAVWASDNPFKQGQSPLPDRMRMLQLMIENLSSQRPAGTVELHPILSHRYTAITLERARELWPQAAFTFVIGADLVQQMPKWYQADAIFQQARILVFPRPGYPLYDRDLRELRQQGATLDIATPPQQFDISSSAYRHATAQEPITQNQATQDQVTQGVPRAVQDYIHQHHLYPCLESPRPRNPAQR